MADKQGLWFWPDCETRTTLGTFVVTTLTTAASSLGASKQLDPEVWVGKFMELSVSITCGVILRRSLVYRHLQVLITCRIRTSWRRVQCVSIFVFVLLYMHVVESCTKVALVEKSEISATLKPLTGTAVSVVVISQENRTLIQTRKETQMPARRWVVLPYCEAKSYMLSPSVNRWITGFGIHLICLWPIGFPTVQSMALRPGSLSFTICLGNKQKTKACGLTCAS